MNRKCFIAVFTILLIVCAEGRKTSSKSRGSGSGRGSSKKNPNPQPAPTSFSYPQPSAPKPSYTGWQERPAQKSNTQTLSSWQSKPSSGQQSHSYPSSGTGLSGSKPNQPPINQESIQRSNAPNNMASQQAGHSYPASTGLSGSSGSGYPQQNVNKYPQQATGLSGNAGSGQPGYPQSSGSGLSGSGSNYPQHTGGTYPQQTGAGMPQQHGTGVAGYAGAPPPYSGPNYQNSYGQNNNYHPQGPPPPYTNYGSSGFGGHAPYNPGYGSQTPGYFGNYGKNYGGVSKSRNVLTGVGIAGAGIGTVLTGLALWNLARSTGHHQHTVIYDNRGQPVAVAPTNDTSAPVVDSILADLVNCSLTISNDDKTEVLAIPCAIATSFTPDADVKEAGINGNKNDSTKCTVTVLTKTGKEYMTTIPCSILLNTAAENNVTEPPIVIDETPDLNNGTNNSDVISNTNGTVDESKAIPNVPTALRLTGDLDKNDNIPLLDCAPEPGELRDPINPCYSVKHNLTVIPLPTTVAPI